MRQPFPHQRLAIDQLKTGSILDGGVGSGKSLAAIAYYYEKQCGGSLDPRGPLERPVDLYVITTAKKRDSLDWEEECSHFMISTDRTASVSGVKLTVDSWNNVTKYVTRAKETAFFIFDEQRSIGSGAWAKAFIKIAKKHDWIMLSATPGDTWVDYVSVFIANGFFKNRTEFDRRHVVYQPFIKFPKIDRFVDVETLSRYRKEVLVRMPHEKHTVPHNIEIPVGFYQHNYDVVSKHRWHIYENRPIKNSSDYGHALRRVVNSGETRYLELRDLLKKHPKMIVFYNYDYERDRMLWLRDDCGVTIAEWNGHKHETIPDTNAWVYLVQYTAGAEAWECIETDTMVFYSQSNSYRAQVQSAGRIDRNNTPFTDLYYYRFVSDAPIEKATTRSVKAKKNFNQAAYAAELWEKQNDQVLYFGHAGVHSDVP